MAKHKEEKTNVMRVLEQKKIPYTAHVYEAGEGPEGTREYGVHVARALGQDPARGFKTLVARGASKGIYVFEVPVAENLDLKKAARAVGEKSVELLHVAEINAVTGYIRGGCSPVGMKKLYPTVFHKTALDYDTIYISAGKIGAQVEVPPRALVELLRAETADITAESYAP
ncbi:Cys-tRNA(Pro) deacylase [Dysosmobacter sp.]